MGGKGYGPLVPSFKYVLDFNGHCVRILHFGEVSTRVQAS